MRSASLSSDSKKDIYKNWYTFNSPPPGEIVIAEKLSLIKSVLFTSIIFFFFFFLDDDVLFFSVCVVGVYGY